MISMCIIQYLCVYYNFYVYTTISMCILQSLCVYYCFELVPALRQDICQPHRHGPRQNDPERCQGHPEVWRRFSNDRRLPK